MIEKKGGPDVLEYREDEPEPTPGDDDLLVAVEAVGVNYRDVYEREGRGAAYGNAKVPLIVGAEGAGTVLEGERKGERVVWAAAPASYAERARSPRRTRSTGARRRVRRAGRRGDAAGHDRALPLPLDLRGAARRRRASSTPRRAASACCSRR